MQTRAYCPKLLKKNPHEIWLGKNNKTRACYERRGAIVLRHFLNNWNFYSSSFFYVCMPRVFTCYPSSRLTNKHHNSRLGFAVRIFCSERSACMHLTPPSPHSTRLAPLNTLGQEEMVSCVFIRSSRLAQDTGEVEARWMSREVSEYIRFPHPGEVQPIGPSLVYNLLLILRKKSFWANVL